MKNRKHCDNSSMSIQIKFKKEESELNETDVNGNSNKFANSELEASHCHGHMTSPEKNLSGSQATFENSLHIKRQNGRKLLPLRISKARLPSFPESNKDNNSASLLHQNSKPNKSAKDQSIFKTGKCKNIFSDFSMSHFSEVRHARTDISVKIGGPNNKREITDKKQQKYPKLQVSLTLNEKEPEKDCMSMTASDRLHSVTHDKTNGNPQSLSILVCEYDTSDDNSELKSKSKNGTLSDSDNFFCNSSQEDGQLIGDHIPQLSPISNHRADNFYMLPSPQYLLQPPILTPISEDLAVRTESDKSFFWLKAETNTQESSTVCTSKQKSNSSLTPVHISAVKEALKRTCHALESTCGDKNNCDFKDKNVLLHKSDEIMCNRSEKNVLDILKSQKFNDSLKIVDNIEKLTTEENINTKELLASSTKDSCMSFNHEKNSMQKDINRNKNTLRGDNTARNDTENNVSNVNSKVYTMNTKRNDRKEAGIKLFSDFDENNQLKRITESLGSVDLTLMHSEVKTSRHSELIFSSLEPQLVANIGSLNSLHTKTKPNLTESPGVPSSIASSASTEDCKYNTRLEQECCDESVENPSTEQLRSLTSVFPTQKATHKREPDKLSSACSPAASNEAFKPFLMEEVSETHHLVALTQNQKDPSMLPSSTSRDVSGLNTDNMKPVLHSDTKDKMSLEHDSRLRGAAFSTERMLKPTNSCDVTLGENPQQLSQSKPNPQPVVNTQMCTAFEKDLFLDMYIKDERQPPSATPRDKIINPLQHERSSDVHTLSATKRQSSDNHHCDQSLKISEGGLGSQCQSTTSTFQSKYVEAISRDLKPGLQTVISPRHYKITNATGSIIVSPETSNLPIRADKISPCYDSHATGLSNDTFTSTARTVTSQPNVVRASHRDARDFKVSASNTLRIMPANPTVITVSSTDASLVSQTNVRASHVLPQKVNVSLNNIIKPSTKLDPDAVKDMSHRIIHHSSRRHFCYPKETTHENDQWFSAYTAQPTAVTMTSHAMTTHAMTSHALTSHAMTSHTNSASHTSQNVHKSKRSSVISMANCPKAKTQHSQLQVSSTEPAQKRIYFPCEASVPVRQDHNNNQSTWQPNKVDNKYVAITKHTNSEHIFSQVKPDHLLANSAYVSPYHRELARKASITSSSSLNYHIANNGICNDPAMLYTQQQVLRSANQQVPFETVTSAEPHQSVDCYNVFNHVPNSDVANKNRNYLHTSELANGADGSALVQVQSTNADRSRQLLDLSNLHSSSQAQIHEADDCMQMHIFSCEAEDSAQTHEFPIITEDSGKTFKIPYEVETCEFLKEAEDTSQTCEFPNGEDSAQTSEFSNEPLDLSLPKEKKHTPFSTEEVSVDLTLEDTEPIVKITPPSIETSLCQPNMSVGKNIRESPAVTTYRLSIEEVSGKQTICQNRDLLVSSNTPSTLPQNSMVNSLPTPGTSAKHQGICHRSPLLETALRHNIIPKDIDPHPFNTVVPECLITQPLSSDKPECRPLPNSQIGYKALHASQTASSQPPKLLSSTTSAVPAKDHTCLVTSATVISLPVSQSSQSLMSLLANTEVTKDMGCSTNKQTGQHPSAVPTFQEKLTSGLTMQQQITNTQSNYSYMASTSRHPSNNVVRVGSVSPKVVPLPVKDFFTHTPKDNTYSALLMAKITKNKQSPGYQKVNELLRNYRSQNSSHGCSLEIGNRIQRSFIIDLTDSDDDCKLLPVSPQENPTGVLRTRNRHVTSKNHNSEPGAEIADSCATEITSAHKDNTEDVNSVNPVCASGFSTMTSNLKDQIYLENALPVNTANNINSGVPDIYIVDVESNEPYHSQKQREIYQNKSYEHVPNTENSVFTHEMLQTDKPAESLHLSSDCTHSHTVNENVDKTARTKSSRAFSSSALDLKIDTPGKELMAKKLHSAMSMRTHAEEQTQRIFPLTLPHDTKEAAYTEAQQSPVCSFKERVQTSTGTSMHDNSTQRAAATLLELSANPIYNPLLISPEGFGYFQEKVYQIHPFLSEDENNKWDTAKDSRNNRLDVQTNQSFSAAGTKASKNRSSRRVGRPPKDQYSSFDSVTSVKSRCVSTNNTIPTPTTNNATTIIPGPLREAKLVHSVTPYGCSNVIVYPQNVAYESHKPIVSIEPDAMLGVFHFNYDFTAQNQLITDGHGSTIPTKENRSLRGSHESKSQTKNIIESLGHNPNNSPQFRERMFASVASKTASDMILSNTAIQAMTVNNVTHLSNGLNVVHNSNTRTLFSKSPTNNISDLENITRDQSGSGGLVANEPNQNHSVVYSLPSASVVSDCLVNHNPIFATAKECNSDTDKRSKARKRKYQNSNNKEVKTAQSHSTSVEAVPTADDFHSACLGNTCMSAEDLTNQINNSNEYHELSKNKKKKRIPKGRVRKRKSKARNKNSKISHLKNADQDDLHLNSGNPQDNRVNTRQAKKANKSGQFYFQDDDDQTIQYGLDNLQMTDNYVPVLSTSAGLPVSDHLLWETTMVSGDMSISNGISNMEKNEHQKELEVTSLLAFMMCNKYKGQV